MSIKAFIPTIWSNQILNRLRDILIYQSICNTDYEGEIAQAGDTVKINEIGPITIQSYTRNSTADITWEFLTDAQKELKIDQSPYFAFAVDDLDKAQAKPNVLPEAMNEAAWGLTNNVDEYIAAFHGQAGITTGLGATGTGKDVTSGTVLNYISLVAARMDQANVPMAGRWMVVPPWFHHKMILAKVTKDIGFTDQTLVRGGFIGNFYGFNIFWSNNVVNPDFEDNAKVMAGYRGTISLAFQIRKVEAVRPAKQFIDLIKGMLLYGAKVVRPASLACLTADYKA
ncbi:P22 coat protein - protein 5 domain protein, partial [bacterium]|nr:P22 coat protein - protein 5 domain protein [bacterium]